LSSRTSRGNTREPLEDGPDTQGSYRYRLSAFSFRLSAAGSPLSA
jgi:hypothetical protein